MPPEAFIHPTATVEDGAVVAAGTRIWHRSHVRAESRIGVDCTIGFAVYVDTGVVIGDRCKIQNHVSLYRGVVLEDDVFVGPAATFTNDLYPRSGPSEWEVVPTEVRRGASLGANATVGAGSVITADVPAHGLMLGTPARLRGWVCICGHVLTRLGEVLPPACRNCGRASNEMVVL